MSKLVNDLISKGYLKTDRTIDAFSEISRIEFVPEEFELQSDANIALPIGFGQTISQPQTVVIMFELLDPQEGQKILEVGSGSGWTSALLAYIVGSQGKIISLERIKELMEVGRRNVDKFGYVKNRRVDFFAINGVNGYPKEAPYDRILVSAEGEAVPEELKKQMKIGGKMVIPIRNSIWFLEKKSEDEFIKEEYGGFSFVPLIID